MVDKIFHFNQADKLLLQQVKIRCGVENKLLSVDEPSRCAYLMEFATPCACETTENIDPTSHDEL